MPVQATMGALVGGASGSLYDHPVEGALLGALSGGLGGLAVAQAPQIRKALIKRLAKAAGVKEAIDLGELRKITTKIKGLIRLPKHDPRTEIGLHATNPHLNKAYAAEHLRNIERMHMSGDPWLNWEKAQLRNELTKAAKPGHIFSTAGGSVRGEKIRGLTPNQFEARNRLGLAHEVDETGVKRISTAFVERAQHGNPDVILREHNRVTTLPKSLRPAGDTIVALRTAGPEAQLIRDATKTISGQSVQFGQGPRLSRHARKRIGQNIDRQTAYKQGSYAAMRKLGGLTTRGIKDPFKEIHRQQTQAFKVKMPEMDTSKMLKRLFNNPFSQPQKQLTGQWPGLRV